MSNRIDLTQFEGITEGKWQWFTGDGKKGLALFPSVEENDDILLWDETDPLAANQYTANANAIAAVPDLLAELKRCYEELDSQHKMISELIEANTAKGEILDTLRICDECGEGWDYHPSGADCEADRQQASE